MTQIKICGITNLDDAMFAAQAGADMLGFIFYPPSPRYIAPERARDIVQAIRDSQLAIRFVGVFVNAPPEQIRAVMTQVQLDYAQLHGEEAAETLCALSPRAIKALRPRDLEVARAQIELYRSAANCTPAFLIDAFDAKQFGGTGKRADWDIAKDISDRFSILLAGGLTSENVAEALRVVQPWGVDVSSGVEREPGLKDHAKVGQFIRNVKMMDHVIRDA